MDADIRETRQWLYEKYYNVNLEMAELHRERGDAFVFEVLTGIYSDRSRPEHEYADQCMAGHYLFLLQPKCPGQFREVVRPILETYNYSESGLPSYLALQFGLDRVLKEIAGMEAEPGLSPREMGSLDTFTYWLGGDETESELRATLEKRREYWRNRGAIFRTE